MAQKKFILQGLTEDTHQTALEHLFACPQIERVIISIAFVNSSGVELVAAQLEPVASCVEVYAGVRNEITTRQGLDRLLELGCSLYVVDTGAQHVIFHPKIYYARGQHEARTIVGSANLTLSGLNNNIEASMVLDLNFNDANDSKIASDIESNFTNLAEAYPKHIVRVTKTSELIAFQDEGRLVDESRSSPPRIISRTNTPDRLPRMKLKVSHLVSKVTRTNPSGLELPNVEIYKPTPTEQDLELVWKSKSLTERDLNIPSGTNTNPTGSVNLDKGLLEDGIDHRHYFREEVFFSLPWMQTGKATVEETYAKFRLVVKSVDYGEFELRIAHTTGTESPTYKQKNAMTRLSWGPARDHVARSDLIGRTLSLYRNATDQTRFVIEID